MMRPVRHGSSPMSKHSMPSKIIRHTPTTLKVSELLSKNGVTVSFKGIQAALQKMVEGDKWEIWIPYQLGGGKSKASTLTLGFGGASRPPIPAYSTLVFEIEVVEVMQ